MNQAQLETGLSQLIYTIYADGSGAPGFLIQSETLVSVLPEDPDSGHYLASADVAPLTPDDTGIRA
jgi:hypothetical protein